MQSGNYYSFLYGSALENSALIVQVFNFFFSLQLAQGIVAGGFRMQSLNKYSIVSSVYCLNSIYF